MTAPDPFALGGIDPLIALGSEKSAITEQLDAISDDLSAEEDNAISAPLTDRLIEIEDRIAELVPISLAGAVIKLRRLREFAEDFEWDESHEAYFDILIAGLERRDEQAP